MTLSLKRLPIMMAGSLLILSLAGVSGCRKKPASEITQAPEIRKDQKETVELLQKAGLKLYPRGEILDTTRKDQTAPEAPESNPEGLAEVTVARAWIAVPDSVEKVQEYYSASHPYVLTREHRSDGTLFVQLASVEKISDAIAQGVSPITLVDIRKKPLTAAERSAYEGEIKRLHEKKSKDRIDLDRTAELQRLLAEPTLVKLSLRSQNS